jgi:hypothetical protein
VSEVASLIADMVRQGIDPDMIGRVAEALAGAQKAADPQAERRRAKDRERKRASGIPQNSADSAEQRVSPTPPSERPPIPPLKGGTFPQTDQPSLAKPLPAEPQKTISAWAAEIWEITPRPGRERSGKRNLENALKAAQRRGEDLAAVKVGLAGYFSSPDATKADGQFCQGVHVVVSSGRWEAFAAADPPSTADPPDPWRQRMTRWKHARYWDSEWGPKPGKPGCLAPETYLEEQAA